MITVAVIFLAVNTVLLLIVLLRNPLLEMTRLKTNLEAIEKNQENTQRLILAEISQNRDELQKSLSTFNTSISQQLSSLTQLNEQKLEKVRSVVEERLRSLQEENSQKLEQMRATVDEKLHSTLEKRLGESFKIVSERLEKVHQGLGEMQTLASGVGDLKKVLTNVKTRGTWGEIQLANLLEQILIPEQYDMNVITKKGSRDPVEFAIKLPGRDQEAVWLPVDAKFPREDYERLQEAQDRGDAAQIEESGKAIEARIKLEARNIRDKYIDPPHTTDFGILFLPIEGLFAEVVRRSGFCDTLQREYRVMVAGPTTIAALLNALQMGFRTLAVEKRASEVWSLLGTVKNEFKLFGEILDKTHKKLQEASHTIESAASKSRNIERKLKDVQGLPTRPQDTELLEEKNADALFD